VGNIHDLLKKASTRALPRATVATLELAARYGSQAPRVDDQGCPRSLGHGVLSGSAVDEILCARLDLLIVPMSQARGRRDINGGRMLSAQQPTGHARRPGEGREEEDRGAPALASGRNWRGS
jgi:hypothetical protein